jgi:hypothetical protein
VLLRCRGLIATTVITALKELSACVDRRRGSIRWARIFGDIATCASGLL